MKTTQLSEAGTAVSSGFTPSAAAEPTTNDATIPSNDDTKKAVYVCGSDEVVVTVVAEDPTSIVKEHDAVWVNGLLPLGMTSASMYADDRQSAPPPRPHVVDPVADDVAPPIDTATDEKAAAKFRDEVLEWAQTCLRKAESDPETWPVHTLHVRGMGPFPTPRYFDSLRGSPRRHQFYDLRQRLCVGFFGGMPPKEPQKKREREEATAPMFCEECGIPQSTEDTTHSSGMHKRTNAHKKALYVWQLPTDATPQSELHCVLCNELFKTVQGLQGHEKSSLHIKMMEVRSRRLQSAATAPSLGGDRNDLPKGIKNLDNSCFASAVLQALSSVPAIVKYAMEATEFVSDAQEELCGAIKTMSLPAVKGIPLVPSSLLDCFPQFRKEIFHDEVLDDQGEPTGAWNVTYPQHDACEFLDNIMTEGLLGGVGRNCFMQVRSKKTCNNCSKETQVTDHISVSRMKFLTLPEVGAVSLQQLWDAQFKPEIIAEYRCAACVHPYQENTCITVPRLTKYPEHLVMQINRAGINGEKMKGLSVNIPDVFQPAQGAPKYFLRSIIRHRGVTARVGHYVAERVFNGMWFCCDDEIVKRGRNMSGDPYVVVYTADGSDLPAALPTAKEALQHLAGKKKGVIKCDLCHSETNDCTFADVRGLKVHKSKPEHFKAQCAYKRGVKGLVLENKPDWCGLCERKTADFDAHAHNSREHKVFAEAYRRGGAQAALTRQNFAKRSTEIENNDAEIGGDGTVERDPHEAMRTFYEESLPKPSADLREHHLTADVAEGVLQGYRARLRDDQPIHECGVCGVRSLDAREQRSVPLTSPLLERLKVEEILPEGCGLKLCMVPGKIIHCDERCVVGEELLICRSCHYHMTTQDTAPVGSFKRLDFGEVPRHLPDLSVCEKALISRVLVQRTVIKLHVRGGGLQCSARFGTPYKGHVISFRQEPSFMRTFMDVGMLQGHITVVLVGKSIGGDHVKQAFEQMHSVFHVRADVLQQWITWLSLHNHMYANCIGHVIDRDNLAAFQAILRKSVIIHEQTGEWNTGGDVKYRDLK